MFERFTDRARASVVLAQEQARRLHHSYIGTEHLLLGLLAETDGVARRVLGELGVRASAVEAEVTDIVGRGDAQAPPGHIPFTPRAKKVLELSLREALQLGHRHIGTEHILLGLLREGEGVAAQVLAKHKGVTREAVRARVVAHLGAAGPERRRPMATTRTPAAQDVLQSAEQLAGDAPVGSHHLLEALLTAEGSMAANALSALGVDPDVLAAKLTEIRLEDTTDMSPEEAAIRGMELRIDGDEVHVVLRDESTLARSRLVVSLAGGAVTGVGPYGPALIPVWGALHNSLDQLEAAMSSQHGAEEPTAKGRRRRRKPATG